MKMAPLKGRSLGHLKKELDRQWYEEQIEKYKKLT